MRLCNNARNHELGGWCYRHYDAAQREMQRSSSIGTKMGSQSKESQRHTQATAGIPAQHMQEFQRANEEPEKWWRWLMSTYSVMLWTVIFPPHPPYPQPSSACRWLDRFLSRLRFAPSPRVSRPGWRAAWKTRSGASTPPPRASAWPVDGRPGPERGTGMWQSCAPATGPPA